MHKDNVSVLKQLQIQAINPGAYSGQGWHNKISQKRMASINPSTGDTLAEIATCSMRDYQSLILRAEQAFQVWHEVSAPKRGEIIRQIGQILREYKGLLGTLIALEMGKSKQEADGEVQEMIDVADFAVGQSRMLYGKTMHSERHRHRMYEQWHPYGIVGIISAFNFPVAVWAWNAFIAAICGNVCVWKPSAKTPLCAIAVQHLCNQILLKNQCPEIFSLLIPDSHDIAEAMVDDSRIPLISFTGSTPVGKRIAARIASRLGKSILDLGGNNAIIVDESADLAMAIPAILFGAVGTAGQRCTSTRRLFVHEARYEYVLQYLLKAYRQITVGDPLETNTIMGPLIDEEATQQFVKAIRRIKDSGGRILCGGVKLDRPGYFVEPTLISEVKNEWPIVQEETFAPILYLMSFSSLSEAITLQNGVTQGLSSSLFTQNLKNSEQFLSAGGSDCGIANINIGTSGAEIGGAFGGEKETGGGRECGSDAWKAYMRRQTNTKNWGDDLPLAQGIRFMDPPAKI